MRERYDLYVTKCAEEGREPFAYEYWVQVLGKIRPANAERWPHYFPELPQGVSHMDVYRVLDAFKVKRSSVQHAVKKLLCSGKRGVKDERADLLEAKASIERALEMMTEEEGQQ
jgi:hypothetical protein